MTLSFAQKCLYPHQGLLCAFFLLLLKAFVELKVGRRTKAYLFQIFCKIKDWIKKSKQCMQPWARDQVYGMEIMEVNDNNSKYDFSLFLNFLDMASFFSLFLTCEPSCAHFFLGSCSFDTQSFLSTSLWVMLLWHAIFPLYLTVGHASLACHLSSFFFLA